MPKEHATRSGQVTPFWCLTWLVAVFVIGIAAEVLLTRNGVASSQPAATLIGILVLGEAIVYLVLLLVPTNSIVPPGRIVAAALVAMGMRALMAFASMKVAVIVQYATPSPDLWMHFYAGQWLGALVQIVIVGLYLWLVRTALELPRTSHKLSADVRNAQTDYMSEFRVVLHPDDEETRQRQDQLLTALMEVPDAPVNHMASGASELLQDAGVDAPATAGSASRSPMPTYDTDQYGQTHAETVDTQLTTPDNTFTLDAFHATTETTETAEEPPMPAFLLRDEPTQVAPYQHGEVEDTSNASMELAGECTDQMVPIAAPFETTNIDDSNVSKGISEEKPEMEATPSDVQGQLPLVSPEPIDEQSATAPTFAEIIAGEPERSYIEAKSEGTATAPPEINEPQATCSTELLPAEIETALRNAASNVVAAETVATAASTTNKAYALMGIGPALGDTPSDIEMLNSLDALMDATQSVMKSVHSGMPGSVIVMGTAGAIVAASSRDGGSQLVIRSDGEKKLGQLSLLARKSKIAVATLSSLDDFVAPDTELEELPAYEEASTQVKRRTGTNSRVFYGNGRNVITLVPPVDAARIATTSEKAYEAAMIVATTFKLGAVQRILIEGQETGLVVGPFSADADVLIVTYAEATSKMGAANVTLGKFDASLRGEV